MAQPGDLVIVFGDNSPRCWKQIIYFNASDHKTSSTQAQGGGQASVPFEDMMDGDQSMVRDARGVRLARGNVDDGD